MSLNVFLSVTLSFLFALVAYFGGIVVCQVLFGEFVALIYASLGLIFYPVLWVAMSAFLCLKRKEEVSVG